MDFLAKVLGIGFLQFLISFYNGYVLSVLWGWFIVPTFGLKPLTLVPAIGLAIVAGFLTSHYSPHKDDGLSLGEGTLQGVLYSFIMPTVSLFTGWVAHLFM